ncbi:hypothetical protein OMK64_00310 [Cellulomonas fimi]|uniref:hypothetical protein n=1 Tax=Cellulomonas fimi TaxID=1708 RepID=UPI00234C9BA1|nr:hypothetical protein [Cellulomonas fimi]MDC7119974.1 hypothetical protein [Cellulomonas fimi]
MQPLSTDVLTKAASTFVLGLVVGAVGTAMHRSAQPWGLVLCLLLVACAGFLSRAWGGGVALAGLAGGMFLSVTTLSRSGPGGDVLVPAQQGIGWAWVVGAVVALVAAAVAPRALFRDEPRGERPRPVPSGDVPEPRTEQVAGLVEGAPAAGTVSSRDGEPGREGRGPDGATPDAAR